MIRKANREELPEIMRLFDRGRAFMRSYGNTVQWVNGYPGEELLMSDIQKGNLYVMEENGELCVVFAMIFGQDPTYGKIDGAWLSDTPYATVHRMVSSGKVKGAAGECMEWAYRQAGHLRGDTHESNLPMQRLFLKHGFTLCGTITVSDGTPRLAYERL